MSKSSLFMIIVLAVLAASGLTGWLAGPDSYLALAAAAFSLLVLVGFGLGWRRCWHAQPRTPLWLALAGSLGLLLVVAAHGLGLVWLFHPEWLPVNDWYDFIANRQVTERLVDPSLLKVERWNILGQEKEVLFVHPSPAGSTALVYPVKIRPRTYFSSDLAIAPGAWDAQGDGVTFSVFVENDAGIHLLYSRYVDPKHQQQDRGWLPVHLDLSAFSEQLVRVILVVNSGPAGDDRFDWSGWANPHLEQPVWP